VKPSRPHSLPMSAWFGFIWAIVLPSLVAATISSEVPWKATRRIKLASTSEWWQWWSWSDGAWAWLFSSVAASSAAAALICIAKRLSTDVVLRVNLWISMCVGSAIWLFSATSLAN